MTTLRFLLGYWWRSPAALIGIASTAMVSGLAEVGVPFLSGRLVDTLMDGGGERRWHGALWCIAGLTALSVIVIVTRHIAYSLQIRFTSKMMSAMNRDAFARAMRFDVDWHINRFSGALTRTITRAVWAVDSANDAILLEVWPSFLLLCGFIGLLGWYWPLSLIHI